MVLLREYQEFRPAAASSPAAFVTLATSIFDFEEDNSHGVVERVPGVTTCSGQRGCGLS